jgi:hypothetical protein
MSIVGVVFVFLRGVLRNRAVVAAENMTLRRNGRAAQKQCPKQTEDHADDAHFVPQVRTLNAMASDQLEIRS